MKQNAGKPTGPRRRLGCHAATTLVLIVAAAFPVVAGNKNNQLCFPSVQWSGFGNPPNNTKPVSSDSGWNGAFRYIFGTGLPIPDVVVQGVRDASNLYISIEAHNMADWDNSNEVLLTFAGKTENISSVSRTGNVVTVTTSNNNPGNPFLPGHMVTISGVADSSFNGTFPIAAVNGPTQFTYSQNGANSSSSGGTAQDATTMQRLYIVPFNLTNTTTYDPNGPIPGVVYDVHYAQDSSIWNTQAYTFQPDPSWVNARSTYTCLTSQRNTCDTTSATSYSWSVALQLPITTSPPNPTNNPPNQTMAITLPTNGLFGFYVNVIRVVPGLSPSTWMASQSYWPNDDPAHQAVSGCIAGSCTPETYTPGLGGGTPDPSFWGYSTRDTSLSCKGVSLGSQNGDIFTDNTPWSKIALPPGQNVFHARVHNNTVAGNGVAIPAPQIRATFCIANFGLPSLAPGTGTCVDPISGANYNWSLVPPVGGSTCPVTNPNPTNPHDIPANSSFTFDMGPWCLTATQVTDYSTVTTSHQCIKVMLDGGTGAQWQPSTAYALNATVLDPSRHVQVASTAGTSGAVEPSPWNDSGGITADGTVTWTDHGQGTVILNNTAFQNMDFGSPRILERVVEIGAQGYPARPCPPGQLCRNGQLFDLHIFAMTEKFAEPCGRGAKQPGKSVLPTAVGAGGGVTRCSQLTYVVHGCRHTGSYITINGKKLELCDGVGAFGFVHQYDGDATGWTTELRGPGLQKTGPGLYQIHVPQNGAATVTTKLEPRVPKLALLLDLGGAFPHGTFGNAFNPGFSLNAGLEYMINPHISAEGIFGYHHFPSNIAGVSDENVYQFGGNAKFYWRRIGPFRLFVNGGISGYKFSPGSTEVGGNFGGGVLRELNAHWGLQACYNFHIVNTPVAATKFSTAQGGIRYVF
jgi:hypothetical protein